MVSGTVPLKIRKVEVAGVTGGVAGAAEGRAHDKLTDGSAGASGCC